MARALHCRNDRSTGRSDTGKVAFRESGALARVNERSLFRCSEGELRKMSKIKGKAAEHLEPSG